MLRTDMVRRAGMLLGAAAAGGVLSAGLLLTASTAGVTGHSSGHLAAANGVTSISPSANGVGRHLRVNGVGQHFRINDANSV
jgi:hypothetical protein